jgi:hypothetical protein
MTPTKTNQLAAFEAGKNCQKVFASYTDSSLRSVLRKQSQLGKEKFFDAKNSLFYLHNWYHLFTKYSASLQIWT